VKNLPNSGVFWQKGEIRIGGGRVKSRIIAHFFHNLVFPGFSGENGLCLSRKNYPNRPFWLAKLLFYGLEDWEMERRPVLGIWNSPQNRQENLHLYLHRFSVGDYLPGKGGLSIQGKSLTCLRTGDGDGSPVRCIPRPAAPGCQGSCRQIV
jgi:hypothetical protein